MLLRKAAIACSRIGVSWISSATRVSGSVPSVPPSLFRGTACNALFRERIAADGSLTSHSPSTSTVPTCAPSVHLDASTEHARPPHLAKAAPSALPMSEEQLSTLVQLLQQSRRVVMLTGAGVSTESNIPDYRGPRGAYTTGFVPMTHQQFVASPGRRARYWARSFAGWAEWGGARPNAAHEGAARLQQHGHISAIVTQNVDRLHQRAGARDVLEMHGTTHEVRCMSCGQLTCRHEFQKQLAELNPAAVEYAAAIAAGTQAAGVAWRDASSTGTAADTRKVASKSPSQTQQTLVRRPDGDMELQDTGTVFVVPPCPSCGGICKPDVVFFGDSLPPAKAARAKQLCQECDTLLVVGSSLVVWSAFRLAVAAKKAGAQLIIVNVGPTRADALADFKVEALAGEVLLKLASHPALLIPKTTQ